ncbi:MAG: DUF4406 domain-containing protein [Clostridia bacterium]|nr:DUF4406 domain-containing protein [Clostridia bacterium]
MKHPLIFICSPYRGDVDANTQNARRYCRLAVRRGSIPFAPHLLFTQFLDDSIAREREKGLEMGLYMLSICDELWAFGAPTEGMAREISEAERLGIPVRRFNALGGEVIADE